jgi:hypothetical protein
MPSPGGQVSGMAGRERCCGWAGVGRVGHPLDLPKGYHTPARGQSQTTHAPVPSRAAPGLACGRAVPGRGDAPRLPACKIIGGPVLVRGLIGKTPDHESGAREQI